MKNIKRRKKLIVSSLIAALSILGISTLILFNSAVITNANTEVSQESVFIQLKEQYKKLKTETPKPYIKINDKDYTSKEFQIHKELSNVIQRSNGNQPLSEDQLREEFIMNVVLEDQAKKESSGF